MSIDDSVLVDPFEVGTLDEAAELSALARALELAEGFSLIFVRCNQAPQRERLMKEVQSRLPNLNLQFISFREPINHLLDSLRERLTMPIPDAIFVSGLEHSLPVIAEASTALLIANLNASRNSFPQTLPCPLVLWIPEYLLTAIAQGAPDFFSIRSGVYAFATAPEELAGLTRTLSAGEYGEVQNLPLPEKRARTAAIKRLLAEYETLPFNQRDRRAELKLLDGLGQLLYAQGNYAEALRQFQRAIKLAEEAGDRAAVASLLQRLGILHTQHEEYAEALQYSEQALRIMGELGHLPSVASLLHNIGNIHYLRRDYVEALRCYEQSLRIDEKLNNHAGIANSLHQLGMLHQAQGDYAEALRHYEQSLQIAEKLGNRVSVASSLHQLGMLHQARGESAEALRRYEQSRQIAAELGDQLQVANSLGQAGRLFKETKRYEEAFPLMLNALETFLQMQSPNARIAVNDLRTLRAQWGTQAFDAAWRAATKEDVPEWLQETSSEAS